MSAFRDAFLPGPQEKPAILAGYTDSMAQAGNAIVNHAGDAWSGAPIAGPLGAVGSDANLTCVRLGREVVVLEGSTFHAAR